jgi:hypothetical protein
MYLYLKATRAATYAMKYYEASGGEREEEMVQTRYYKPLLQSESVIA